jgi:hypothetical protein
MKVSRREFIKNGSFSVIGAGLLLSGSQQLLGQSSFDNSALKTDLLYSLDADGFNKFIGKEFTFYTEETAISGVLYEVVAEPVKQIKTKSRFSNLKSRSSDCFYLKFETPNFEFPQATYKVYQESLGQFDLLLVPGETLQGTPNLIATINRI